MSFARPAPADVSYLQARESGYGYGRARASSAALPGLAPPQRDLTDELVEQQSAAAPGSTLRVFLRVRPQLDGDFGDLPPEERKPVHEMMNNVHLLMHAPKDSATYKNGMNGNGKLTHRYTFSHIFRPETDQRQLFRQTTLNHITEFVNGHSCLLFTYGATNSGKTYTVQGTPSEPGLLPRSLDMLFNSVEGRLYGRLDVQPRGFSDVCLVSARDEEAARRLKRETLRLGAELEPPSASELGGSEESLTASSLYRSQDSLASVESLSEVRLCPEVEGRRRESAAACVDNQPNTRFSVWVSYLEIYNDYVYDLLERPPTGKRRRTALHLGLDKKGNSFVKGLRQVPVRSADEAIQVVRAGRQNLHFASNRLNHNSSRSHCVFSVRLIRLLDTDNPSVARVSQFSVCDLAGSERVEKTLAAGARMKEAGNINSSLMVLGRCMKAMRQAQKAGGAPGPAVVPYRDSKLTRIFQSYFCGGLGSRVTMIVNVSPSPVVFDETIQVLKFSALAKQVSIQQAEKRRAPSRFSIMARRSIQMAAAAMGRPRPLLDSTAASLDPGAADDEHQNLLDLVESLRHQLVESRRENAGLESRIREELCAEFQQHVVQIEKDWQQRMQETERYMENRAELQLTAVAAGIKAEYSRKRRRTADTDDEADPDQPPDDDQTETDQLKEVQERLAAAEQRCLLLEQQLEAEAADQQQASQRAAQRQQELGRLAVQLSEQRDTAERLQRERDEAEQRHRRLVETGAADQSLAAELGKQVAQLQEELRFRDMDLRETREYLQEGGDEFLQLEAASERLQRQVAELQQQLAQRDEALRDQQALHADLEELLAGRSQRVDELEAQLERLAQRCSCGSRAATAAAGRSAQPTIPEEDAEAGPQNPAEMSFGSRLRALRSMTGAVLRQVTRPDSEQQQPQAADSSRTVRTAERESQTADRESETTEQESQTAEHRSETAEHRSETAEQETQTGEQESKMTEQGTQMAEQKSEITEQETQTAEDVDAGEQQQQLAEARAESARLSAELAELQLSAEQLTTELRAATDQLDAKTAECAELRGQYDALQQAAAETELLQQQLRQLTEERDRLRTESAARLTETHHELEELQRQYKQALHLKSEAEADAAVCEREMKAMRADLERERHEEGPLQERLRARDAEVTLLRDSRNQVSEALRIIKAELEAKTEELRQNNAAELRAQLERAEADSSHLRDEMEKRSNELLKLNIQIDGLKRQLVERDEDLQKARDERTRSMQMSEQNIRRKNEELNRERHESSHLRDMMARLTPRTSSTLQAELESTRAACRRKDDRIEQLETRLRSSQAELAACTPTPTPRRAAGRTRSVQIVGDDEESDVTPMVLRVRSSRSSRRPASRAAPPKSETEHSEEEGSATGTDRRRTRRRAANRSAVRFTDENAEPELSEDGSSVSGGGGGGGGRTREPLSAIAERQRQQAAAATPADQPPPPRTVKSTGTKRKLFKRCSDQIMECSPVQTAEKRVSPRTVVTRSLRSRKK